MHARTSFDYALIRVVPRVDREEFLNVGLILFCLEQRFLGARVEINDNRLLALWPGVDLATIRRHVEAFPQICEGARDAGPIARLSKRERFHWVVSPRSTIIQISPVHTGLCDDPQSTLDHLFQKLVK